MKLNKTDRLTLTVRNPQGRWKVNCSEIEKKNI